MIIKLLILLYFCIQISHEAPCYDAVRLLKEHTEKLYRGEIDSTTHGSINARLGALNERIQTHTTREAHRLGAWGLADIKNSSGAQLVNPDTNLPYNKEQLLSKRLS